jgi:hypothetical protein
VSAPFLAGDRDDTLAVGRPKGGGVTYYTIPGVGGTGGSLTIAADTDYYAPFMIMTPTVIDQLACDVTAVSSGTNARMGLYRADRNWQPTGAPLVDSGTVDISTTGTKTYTPGTPVHLSRGRYLTVFNSDTGNPSMTTTRTHDYQGVSTTISNGLTVAWRVSRAHAAFPTPGTPWDTVTASIVGFHQVVHFRVLAP